jgi:hypothetical protein
VKDHEIIETIEKAIDSAEGEQRQRIDAWLRSKVAAESKPASAPAPEKSEAEKHEEQMREILKRLPPISPPFTDPPWTPPWPGIIGTRPWWEVPYPGDIWQGPICDTERFAMGLANTGGSLVVDKAIHDSGPVASAPTAIAYTTNVVRLAS